MNTKPRSLLTSHVRPQNWNPHVGNPLLDWEMLVNDWFLYTVDWFEDGENQSIQLLADRDNSYTIIHSRHFLRKTGVFTSQERRLLKEIFSPANLPAYQSDGLSEFERTFSPEHPVLRLGMWVATGHRTGSACWGEANLSPATQHLITTFDQFLTAKVGSTTRFPARSILSN
ncbi:MAG TPA: hypothetical protein VHO25_23620 [Polyangiaceae bacterium]|nr:hypothetical protein [Polyangiaceae bacterium]